MIPLLAHAGHWLWQVLLLAPVLCVVLAVWIANRRDPERDERLAMEAQQRADRELDELLSP